MIHRLLADLVLLVHFGFVVFVVGGLMVTLVGNLLRRWAWVNRLWFRAIHLAAIGVVVAQAWLGVVCPLTTLESWLRARGGGAAYGTGFIQHWVQRILFFEAPAWVFTTAYTVFGLLVIAAWWWFPPRAGRRRAQRADSPA